MHSVMFHMHENKRPRNGAFRFFGGDSLRPAKSSRTNLVGLIFGAKAIDVATYKSELNFEDAWGPI